MFPKANSLREFIMYRFNHQAGDYALGSIHFGKRDNCSDISAHLPLLRMLSKSSRKVTEFGVKHCYSTCGLLAGCNDVTSYDIVTNDTIKELQELAPYWKFKIQDTGDPNLEIEETDFLFIDGLHTYEHVKKELRQAKHVRKFIGFHDIVSQGLYSHDIHGAEGINRAIQEFLNENQEWNIIYEATFNHGLLVIARNR